MPAHAIDQNILDPHGRDIPPQAVDARLGIGRYVVPDRYMRRSAPGLAGHRRLAGDQLGECLVVKELIDARVARGAEAPGPQGDCCLVRLEPAILRCLPHELGDGVLHELLEDL
jgi:hypothetical protein